DCCPRIGKARPPDPRDGLDHRNGCRKARLTDQTRLSFSCAEGGTRTPTSLRPLAPEASASTSSTTSASSGRMIETRHSEVKRTASARGGAVGHGRRENGSHQVSLKRRSCVSLEDPVKWQRKSRKMQRSPSRGTNARDTTITSSTPGKRESF